MYEYTKERNFVFTELGISMLLAIRDNARRLLDVAGAFAEPKLWADVAGDSWAMLACVDYLVERGDLRRIYEGPARQCNIYIGGRDE